MKTKEIKVRAKEALTGKWGKGIGIFFCYSLITYLLSLIPVVGSIILLIIQPALVIGVTVSMMKLKDNESIGFFDFFSIGMSNFKKAWGVAFNVFIKALGAIIVIFLAIYAFYMLIAKMGTIGMVIGLILIVLAIVYGIDIFYKYKYAVNELIYNPDMSSKVIVNNTANKMKKQLNRAFNLDFSFILIGILIYIAIDVVAAFLGSIGGIISALLGYALVSYLSVYMTTAGIIFYEDVCAQNGTSVAKGYSDPITNNAYDSNDRLI